MIKKALLLALFIELLPGILFAGTHIMKGTPFVAGDCVQADSNQDFIITAGTTCGGGGSGNFIENSLTPATTTQKFSVQTGSVTGQFTFASNKLPTSANSGQHKVLFFDDTVASFGDAPGFAMVDNTLFTTLVSSFNPTGGVYNDNFSVLSTSAAAAYRMTPYRAQHTNLRNSSGVEIGSSTAHPLYIDGNVNVNNEVQVTITDASVPVGASQVGTWTVQPGNTQNTTSWIVKTSTVGVNGSTIAVVNAVGTTLAVSGSLTVTPPAITTVTFNGVAQPVITTQTITVTAGTGTFTVQPIGITTITHNGVAQPILSTQTFTVTPGTGTWSIQPVGITTVTHNGIGQPVTSTSTFITNIPTVTFNGIGQPVTSTSTVITGSLPTGANTIGSIANTGFNVNNAPTVVQSTSSVNGSTIAVVNAVGTTLAVSGSLSFTPPAITTVTFNGIAQPTITTQTITVTAGTGTFTVQPIGITTVTFNGAGQPVTSTYTVIVASNIYNNMLSPATTGLTILSADENQRLLVTGIPRGQIRQTTATLTTTTETVLISSGASGVFNDLCGCIIINTSTTTTRIDFRGQGNAGTINNAFQVPAQDTRGFWPGCQNPFIQLSPASNWTVQLTTATTDFRVSCQYIPIK